MLLNHAEVFKKNPELCQNLDNMLSMAHRPAQKQGILDAHKIVCTGQIINDGSGQGDDLQDDNIIILDKVSESPLSDNGEYPNNFRDSGYQPKLIDTIGESNVKQIKFSVDFDIEQHYDYLLIKDANG